MGRKDQTPNFKTKSEGRKIKKQINIKRILKELWKVTESKTIRKQRRKNLKMHQDGKQNG